MEFPFHGRARAYAEFRETLPGVVAAQLVDDLLPGSLVADIGCGTGMSSRALLRPGIQVVGIDPDPEMLAEALKRPGPEAGPSLRYQLGTATATGLDSRTVDAVCCVQSFHWFEPDAAMAEFLRILRPGGKIALVWRMVERSTPFARGYQELLHAVRAGQEYPAGLQPSLSWPLVRRLEVLEKQTFTEAQALSCAELLGRSASISYYPRAGEMRNYWDAELRSLFEKFQTGGQVKLPYRWEVHSFYKR